MASNEEGNGGLPTNGNGDVAWDQEEVFGRKGDDSTPQDPESLEARIALERQRAVRTMADFENHKRRVQKERETLLLYSNEKLLREILPILDDLERAVAQAEADADPALASFVSGVKLIATRWNDVLERVGAKPFVSVGEIFDPTFHEAVLQKMDDDAPPATVLEEFEKGYTLYSRLLRPAKVVVNAKRAPRQKLQAATPKPTPELKPLPTPEPGPTPEPSPDDIGAESSNGAFKIDEGALGSLDDWEKEFSD